jgi:hypothetical protein
MALLGFQTYHTVPNITDQNNVFRYKLQDKNTKKMVSKTFIIPIGAYTIDHLGDIINNKLQDEGLQFHLHGDISTQRAIFYSDTDIDFRSTNSIADLLGFKHEIYLKNEHHISEHLVTINKANIIRVLCNITIGNYVNGNPSHVIHEFFPGVAPSFKINETPSTVTYLPISVRTIHNITLRIVDQDGNLIDFREEPISIRLHLKRLP